MTRSRPAEADAHRLAAATWSRIAEAPDPAAGALVAELGAAEALDWVRAVLAGRVSPEDPRWVRAVARWAPRLAGLDIRRELDILADLGGVLLPRGEEGWPAGLGDLGVVEPFALWVLGHPAALSRRAVAMVGSRATTAYGARLAAELAAGVAEAGWGVVSGGAHGVDTAAHRGILAVDGTTIAVVAGGVERPYPAGNAELFEAVTDRGAVLAEVPPGSVPTRNRFLARNRLIAAAGAATVVVEAAWRSGALNTARHAAELNRPLGAVPGPVTSAASAGCHRLMRERAAVCVTDAEEILELASPAGEHLPAADRPVRTGFLDDLDPLAARVLDAMPARGTTSVSRLARTAGVSVPEARSALGVLDLAGRVRHSGGSWARAG